MSPTTIKVIATVAALLAAATAAPVQADATSNEQRYAPNPGLAANLAFRVILAVAGTALCWVPFRLLWRNGDIAAVVLIVEVALMNLFTVLNSLIWNSDNWDTWWIGTGLCDVEVYVWMPLQTIYAAAIFEIIRQVAGQVKLTRASELTRTERNMRALTQAAIIFPPAVVQLIFTWFDISQRYNIGTLVGCMVAFDESWPRFLVYDAPPTLYVLASVPYAFLTWKRFRAISKNTREVLKSNEAASQRATWIRNRLYGMSLSIIVVYLPVSIYLTVNSFQDVTTFAPYNYMRIHFEANPYPWEAILFVPSWLISTVDMNQPWIAIATTIVIVGFFGTTKDGLGMYRQYAMAIGLGRCLSRLKKPHNDPEIYIQGAHPEDGRGTWIELVNQPNRRRESKKKKRPEPINTGRTKRFGAYYVPPNTGTTTTGPSTGNPHRSPLSPLMPPPRCATSTPNRFSPLYSTSASPLDSQVIESMIPPRTSSLAYQRQYYSAVLQAAPPPQPQPKPKPMPSAHPTRPKTRHGPTHPRSPWAYSDQVPILGKPSLSSINRHAESDSPATLNSLQHKTSRDAVQLSSVLEQDSYHRPSSFGSMHGLFHGSGTLTSSTASAIRPREHGSGSVATSVARSSEEGFVRVVIPRGQGGQGTSQGGQGGQGSRRKYRMGALRGRGMSAPRTVDEIKAEGVKSAETYDYSDSGAE
ncbi:pheromone A receptor-domain-containing protein [Annulohypoxylon bovei var. microspora]|nr:pheromone A receptor-domain-containing protein [Annulohypoxylon bovei var. microspora]